MITKISLSNCVVAVMFNIRQRKWVQGIFLWDIWVYKYLVFVRGNSVEELKLLLIRGRSFCSGFSRYSRDKVTFLACLMLVGIISNSLHNNRIPSCSRWFFLDFLMRKYICCYFCIYPYISGYILYCLLAHFVACLSMIIHFPCGERIWYETYPASIFVLCCIKRYPP